MAYLNDANQENHPTKFNRSLTIHNVTTNPQTEFPVKPIFQRHPSIHNKLTYDSFISSTTNSLKGKVRKLCTLFESSPKHLSNPIVNPQPSPPPPISPTKSVPTLVELPGTEDRIVVYFTSLRGIRRTYEDCVVIRMILKAFRVNLDERDVSMDIEYRKELQNVLGEKKVSLPQVFIKGKYIGGAEIVKQLHETGELAKLLKGLPVRAPGPGFLCEGCGDVRFIPCLNCNGSRKVFDEDDEELKRCPECNENGLIRCPACCGS